MIRDLLQINSSIPVLPRIREFIVEVFWGFFSKNTDGSFNSSATTQIRKNEHCSNRRSFLPSHCDAEKRGE